MSFKHNYLLFLEYDGTNFSGWQKQPKARTIQGEIEKASRKIFGKNIRVVGAGRTDKGVHAVYQAANLWTGKHLSPMNLRNALNALIPRDIAVFGAKEAPLHFNCRFKAKKKIYKYYIWNRRVRSIWQQKYVWHIPNPLHLNVMKDAASRLLGRHDFSAFAGSGIKQKNRIVNLEAIDISYRDKIVVLTFRADRFLNHMVRNIVGTLVEAGRENIYPDRMEEILRSGKRTMAGPIAPSQGLFLHKIIF